MLVQVHAASRALNDRLEESPTLLSSYLMPLGALQVDIFGCVIHAAFSSLDPLPSLLHLQPQQVWLRAADSCCAVAVFLVERLTALVESVNKFGALGFVVSVFRQAIWEHHKQRRQREGAELEGGK